MAFYPSSNMYQTYILRDILILQAELVCFITFFSPFSLAAVAASVFSFGGYNSRDLCTMEMKHRTSICLQKLNDYVNFAVGDPSYLYVNSTNWLLFRALSHVTLI
jgi:hypothetical protein